MISPANSMAAKITRAAKPMVTPISNCWITTISAMGESSGITGISGSEGWAHSTIRIARPTRTRRGTVRIENTGAAVNRPSTRKNGQIHGEIHAMTWASLKVTMAAASAHHARDGLQGGAGEIDQRTDHPGAGQPQ